MNQISHLGEPTSAEQVSRTAQHQRGKATVPTRAAERSEQVDRADISDVGKLLSRARELPDVREEKVVATRLAIQQDPEQFIRERLDITVDRLMKELTGG